MPSQPAFTLPCWRTNAELFLSSVLGEAIAAGLPLHTLGWECDHLCLRVSSELEYRTFKDFFEKEAKLLTEAAVRGRPIATFALPTPILAGEKRVTLLELPSPKPGSPYPTGFEHAEWVTSGFLSLPQHYPQFPWETDHAHTPRNPDVSFRLASGRALKFHAESLLKVIQDERWDETESIDYREATAALAGSKHGPQILRSLSRTGLLAFVQTRGFAAAIAGTHPLDLALPSSDVDILVHCPNPEALVRDLQQQFGGNADGNTSEQTLSLSADGFRFEVFVSTLPLEAQNGFLHLRAEARLVAVTGDWCKAPLRALKQAGYSTELAFAKFFGIDLSAGNEFAALREVATWTKAQYVACARSVL